MQLYFSATRLALNSRQPRRWPRRIPAPTPNRFSMSAKSPSHLSRQDGLYGRRDRALGWALSPSLRLVISSIAEWDAEREQGRRWWSMLRANNLRFLSHSFPDGKRNIIHIKKTHLIAGFASLAVDAQGC